MTDERFDRLLADVLAEVAPAHEPDRLFPETIRAARRATPRPRWLALMKEPPMRISSRVAVGSPTVRVGYLALLLAIVAVLAAGVVVAGASLLPSPSPAPIGPRTIVVDPTGAGEVTTITEGVTLAVAGDTVLVRPGVYREWIVIDADITLTGDGLREAVIIEVDPEGPRAEAWAGFESPYAIQLRDTNAVVSHLTIRGADSGIGIKVSGGAPTLEDLAIPMSGEWSGTPLTAFVIADGAAATVRNVTAGPTSHVMRGATPSIEGVVVPHMFINGSAPIISGSSIDWADITEDAAPTITGSRMMGLSVEGSSAVLRDNVFADPGYTIGDRNEANGDGTRAAITIVSSSPVVEGNRIGDQPFGIRVQGGAPTITGNTIEHNAVGVQVVYDAGMTLAGNTFCGNGEDLQASPAAGLSLEGQTCPTPGPSAGAARSMTGATALLGGLRTEEVEPGLYRVDGDGVRPLRWQPPDPATWNPWCCYFRNEMAFSIDGTPWFFRPEGFFGVGSGVTYPWPEELLPWGWLWTGSLDVTVGPTGRPDAILLRVADRAWRAAVTAGAVTWERVEATATSGDEPARGAVITLGPTGEGGAAATNGDISWSHHVVPDASGNTGAESPERWTRSQDGVRTDFEAPGQLPRISRAHDGGGRLRVGSDGALWFTPRNEEAGPYGHCDGLARFDGVELSRYLRGLCLYGLEIGPDGSAWMLAGEDYWNAAHPPVDTYVVPAPAAAAEA